MSSSSFVKKLVLEQGEYDRLQQRQLREYSPELHSLAALKSRMDAILAQKNMSAEDKLNLLSSYRARFDNLRNETGVLSSSVTGTSPSDETPKADAPKDKESGEKKDEAAEEEEEEQVEVPSKVIKRAGVEPMYHKKANRLLLKIMDNSEVLKRNADGELVVNGEAQTGTNFDTLFKSMVSAHPNMHQPGFDKFLVGLRQIGVKANELSSKELQRKFRRPESSRGAGSVEEQLAVARSRLPSSVEEEDENNNVPVKPKHKTKATKEQKGFGRVHKSGHMHGQLRSYGHDAKPPGQRPKILYVY